MLRITNRSKAAIKALIDIGYHSKFGAVQRKDIAHRQKISREYIDKILSILKQKGLVTSQRGREGGYQLAIDENKTSLWDIILAVDYDEVENTALASEKLVKFSPQDNGADYCYDIDNDFLKIPTEGQLQLHGDCTEIVWSSIEQMLKRNLKKHTLAEMMHHAVDILNEPEEGYFKEQA